MLCHESKDKTMKIKSFQTVNICTKCADMCAHTSYVYSLLRLRWACGNERERCILLLALWLSVRYWIISDGSMDKHAVIGKQLREHYRRPAACSPASIPLPLAHKCWRNIQLFQTYGHTITQVNQPAGRWLFPPGCRNRDMTLTLSVTLTSGWGVGLNCSWVHGILSLSSHEGGLSNLNLLKGWLIWFHLEQQWASHFPSFLFRPLVTISLILLARGFIRSHSLSSPSVIRPPYHSLECLHRLLSFRLFFFSFSLCSSGTLSLMAAALNTFLPRCCMHWGMGKTLGVGNNEHHRWPAPGETRSIQCCLSMWCQTTAVQHWTHLG